MTEKHCEQVRQQALHIQAQIAQVCRRIQRDPAEVTLMAVTKTVPPEWVNAAMEAGVRVLGENRVQEFLDKRERYAIPPNGKVCFIGHLQKNKVKYIADKVDRIESLDSVSLALEISRQCEKIGRDMDCLVEVNIGGEESKSGVAPEELLPFLKEISKIPHIFVCGLMTIPPIEAENEAKAYHFQRMRELFVDIRSKNVDNMSMDILSMGMSDDYLLAIEHGSTQVRVGTALFGAR